MNYIMCSTMVYIAPCMTANMNEQHKNIIRQIKYICRGNQSSGKCFGSTAIVFIFLEKMLQALQGN